MGHIWGTYGAHRSTDMCEPGRVLFAPSPNWYGAHLSCLSIGEDVKFVAYCGQRSIVVLAVDGMGSQGRRGLHVHQVLLGYNARTSCVACHVAGDERKMYLVTASQDKCVQTWVLQSPEGDRKELGKGEEDKAEKYGTIDKTEEAGGAAGGAADGGHDGGNVGGNDGEEEGDAVNRSGKVTVAPREGYLGPARQSRFFSRHRLMSKRPAEVKAVVSDCDGTVLLGDVKGNVFQWRLGEQGSRIRRVASALGGGIVTMACLEGVWGIVVVGCVDGSVQMLRYAVDDSCGEGLGEVIAEIAEIAEIGSEGPPGDRNEIHGLACARVADGVHWVASVLRGGRVRVHEVVLSGGVDGVVGAENEDGGGPSAEVRRRVVELDMLRVDMYRNRGGKKGSNEKQATRFWGSVAWGRVGKRLCLLTEGFGGGVLVWWGLEDGTGEHGLPRHQALPESHSRAIFRICTGSMDSGALMISSVGLDRACSVWRLSPMADVKKDLPVKLVSRLVGLGAQPMSLATRQDTCQPGSGSEKRVVVACGGGDSTIRLVSCVPGLDLGVQEATSSQIWRDIPAPVVVLSWSDQEGREVKARSGSAPVLAFGCEDGTVGVVDGKGKKMRLGISRHPAPVCLLSWLGGDANGGADGTAKATLQSWCTSGVSMTWQVDLADEDAKGSTGTPGNGSRRDMEPVLTTQITSDKSRKITCLAPVASLEAWLGVAGAPVAVIGFSRGALEAQGRREGSNVDCLNDVLARYEMDDALSSGARMVSTTDGGDVVVLTDTGSIFVFDVAGGGPRSACAVAATAKTASANPTCLHAASYEENGVVTSYLAVGFDSGIVRVLVMRDGIIDAEAGGTLDGHAGPVLSMTHRRRWLFTSSQDQTVRLWDWTSPSAWSSVHVAGTGDGEDSTSHDLVAGDRQEGRIPATTPESAPPSHPTKSSKKDSGAVGTTLPTLLPGLTMADPADPIMEFRDIAAFVASTASSIAGNATLQHKKDERQSKALSQRAAALHLWQGNVGKALEVLVENDALTSDFVAFAAGAGRDAWIAASRVYADFLERKGEVHLAALYQLQAGDVIDACLTYERHKMHREAAALAQLWLPPDHPVGVRVVEQLATFLSKGGHESACEVVLAKFKSS